MLVALLIATGSVVIRVEMSLEVAWVSLCGPVVCEDPKCVSFYFSILGSPCV